jgi:hypothetical protein
MRLFQNPVGFETTSWKSGQIPAFPVIPNVCVRVYRPAPGSCMYFFYVPGYTGQVDSEAVDLSAGEFIFTFATTRDAIAGEKKLLAGGIRPAVMPLPDQLGAGCGICLRVSPAEREKARTALGAAIQGIYAVSGAGRPGKKIFRLWNP